MLLLKKEFIQKIGAKMTKTLTEQWREGTLPNDTYYWKVCKENWISDKYEMYDYTKVCDVNKIECLAPVPSYDEYKQLVSKSDELILCLQKMVEDECSRRCELEIKCSQLEKKLEIATWALQEYSCGNNWLDAGCRGQVFLPTKRGYSIADKALDEMEDVE